MKVKDAAGVERLAPLFWISPDQIRYQMPTGTSLGSARITVTSSAGKIFLSDVPITKVAPGMFTVNDSGQGFAAGSVTRTTKSGQTYTQSIAYQDASGRVVAIPIDFGNTTDTVDLSLLATGIRFRSALTSVAVRIGGSNVTVLSLAPDTQMPGRDILKVRLPRSLRGRGQLDVSVTVDGRAANTVQIMTK